MQVLLDDYGFAASVATDLVNTAPEVAVSSGDGLSDPLALERFLAEHGLVLEALDGGRRASPVELAAVHRLRRTVREIIGGGGVDSGGGRPGGVGEAAAAGRLVSTAGAGPTLVRDAHDNWRWEVRSRPRVGVAAELGMLVGAGLLGVLRALGPDRFRQCGSPTCHGAFVDVSRGGRRRYCAPEICGNRINVANHRARRRSTSV